jgi:Uma2 family endonuclease
MPVQTHHRFSTQDYHLMAETGGLKPGLMLLKPRPDDQASRHPGPEDVWLLIGVADTSVAYDRGEKLPAYGRAGVREVWIVNLPEKAIEIYRQPHFQGYGWSQSVRPGESAQPQSFPDVEVFVAELLRHA